MQTINHRVSLYEKHEMLLCAVCCGRHTLRLYRNIMEKIYSLVHDTDRRDMFYGAVQDLSENKGLLPLAEMLHRQHRDNIYRIFCGICIQLPHEAQSLGLFRLPL